MVALETISQFLVGLCRLLLLKLMWSTGYSCTAVSVRTLNQFVFYFFQSAFLFDPSNCCVRSGTSKLDTYYEQG